MLGPFSWTARVRSSFDCWGPVDKSTASTVHPGLGHGLGGEECRHESFASTKQSRSTVTVPGTHEDPPATRVAVLPGGREGRAARVESRSSTCPGKSLQTLLPNRYESRFRSPWQMSDSIIPGGRDLRKAPPDAKTRLGSS